MNPLNQYTNRTVPGYIDVQGDANSNATVTVTVNSATAYRYGAYYRDELSVNNSSSPVYQAITNQAVLTPDTVTLNRHALVAATPEPFTYDDDGNLLSDGQMELHLGRRKPPDRHPKPQRHPRRRQTPDGQHE